MKEIALLYKSMVNKDEKIYRIDGIIEDLYTKKPLQY